LALKHALKRPAPRRLRHAGHHVAGRRVGSNDLAGRIDDDYSVRQALEDSVGLERVCGELIAKALVLRGEAVALDGRLDRARQVLQIAARLRKMLVRAELQ